MTTKTKKRPAIKRLRPEEKLLVVSTKAKPENKVVNKQFTAMKAAEGTGEIDTSSMEPTDSQLSLINQYARETQTRDSVRVFPTMSCNDMVDRDLDQFTTRSIGQMKDLKPPFSFTGKAYMVSHDYTKLPVGRIFDTDTTSVEGVKFLRNWVYMLNTPQYQPFLENIAGGIYWAVSVGIMLGSTACSVCASPMYESRFFAMCWCAENGHEKGLWYDPNSDEVDDWGWAEPVEEGTKGAVQCIRQMEDPIDGYELSQCFLGAQYDAQIGKAVGAGVVKSVAKQKVPILNLARTEAEKLPILHMDPRVQEAYGKGFSVTLTEDGMLRWKDESGLVWVYDAEAPNEDERVMSLGRSADDETEDEDDGEDIESEDGTASGSDESGSGSDGSAELERGESDDGEDAEDHADEDEGGDGSTESRSADVRDAEDGEDGDEVDDEDSEDDLSEEDTDNAEDVEEESDDEEEEDEDVDKAAVLAAAASAKLSKTVLDKIRKAKGTGLSVLASAVTDLNTKVAELEPRAALGDKYVEELRSKAIDWYVKANQDPKERRPVSTDRFVKMLDRFGDDAELIKEVTEEQKRFAQAKFPASVRRSAAIEDVNEEGETQPVDLDEKAKKRVTSVHG